MDVEDFCMGCVKVVLGGLMVLLIVALFALPISMYDEIYIKPIASEKANKICQTKGFDFYETYSRVGLLNKEPIAIKCGYVEQYRKIDLNQPLVQVS